MSVWWAWSDKAPIHPSVRPFVRSFKCLHRALRSALRRQLLSQPPNDKTIQASWWELCGWNWKANERFQLVERSLLLSACNSYKARARACKLTMLPACHRLARATHAKSEIRSPLSSQARKCRLTAFTLFTPHGIVLYKKNVQVASIALLYVNGWRRFLSLTWLHGWWELDRFRYWNLRDQTSLMTDLFRRGEEENTIREIRQRRRRRRRRQSRTRNDNDMVLLFARQIAQNVTIFV